MAANIEAAPRMLYVPNEVVTWPVAPQNGQVRRGVRIISRQEIFGQDSNLSSSRGPQVNYS